MNILLSVFIFVQSAHFYACETSEENPPSRTGRMNWSFNYGNRSINKRYDYIIVGAGNAGCVLANRLTEDPKISVLLLEAGKPELPLITDTPLFVGHLQSTDFNYGYLVEPETKACLGEFYAKIVVGKLHVFLLCSLLILTNT
jgi:hypothetical protein